MAGAPLGRVRLMSGPGVELISIIPSVPLRGPAMGDFCLNAAKHITSEIFLKFSGGASEKDSG